MWDLGSNTFISLLWIAIQSTWRNGCSIPRPTRCLFLSGQLKRKCCLGSIRLGESVGVAGIGYIKTAWSWVMRRSVYIILRGSFLMLGCGASLVCAKYVRGRRSKCRAPRGTSLPRTTTSVNRQCRFTRGLIPANWSPVVIDIPSSCVGTAWVRVLSKPSALTVLAKQRCLHGNLIKPQFHYAHPQQSHGEISPLLLLATAPSRYIYPHHTSASEE